MANTSRNTKGHKALWVLCYRGIYQWSTKCLCFFTMLGALRYSRDRRDGIVLSRRLEIRRIRRSRVSLEFGRNRSETYILVTYQFAASETSFSAVVGFFECSFAFFSRFISPKYVRSKDKSTTTFNSTVQSVHSVPVHIPNASFPIVSEKLQFQLFDVSFLPHARCTSSEKIRDCSRFRGP